MSDVLKTVEKLKADRRAELKAQAEERQRLAELAAAQRQREAERDLARTLEEAGALWLAGYCRGTRDGGTWQSRGIREVLFALPGHRTVVLRLVAHSGGWEPAATATGGEMPTWAVDRLSGLGVPCETLADAFIEAEKPDDEPIPF